MRSVGNTGDCAVVLEADTASVLAEVTGLSIHSKLVPHGMIACRWYSFTPFPSQVGEESPQADLFAVAHPSKPSILLGNSGANGLVSTFNFPSV